MSTKIFCDLCKKEMPLSQENHSLVLKNHDTNSNILGLDDMCESCSTEFMKWLKKKGFKYGQA